MKYALIVVKWARGSILITRVYAEMTMCKLTLIEMFHTYSYDW